ncbi:MAG: DUF3826 domain-containing protein, partial [Verrucomicrobia bacterium]
MEFQQPKQMNRFSFLHGSPSPQPSPAGRGRIVCRSSAKRGAGFAGQPPNSPGAHDRCSLSQRERVRVRENATIVFLAFIFLASLTTVFADETNTPTQPEEKGVAYLRTINERATKITATLGIAEAAKSNRVHVIIVQQYRGLNDIHWVRDVEIGNAKAKFASDK